MGFKKVVKKSAFSGIEPTRWVAMDSLKQNGSLIKSIFSSLFKKNNPKESEKNLNFEEARQLYDLTEEELTIRRKKLFLTSTIFIGIAFVLLLYSVYLMNKSLYLGGFTSIMLMFVATAYAFQSHFHYTQLTLKTIQLSLKQWLLYLLKQGIKK